MYGIENMKDTLPPNVVKKVEEAREKGSKIDREMFDKMLTCYYRMRGWDDNGVPKVETLKKLGLDDVIENLRSIGIKLE